MSSTFSFTSFGDSFILGAIDLMSSLHLLSFTLLISDNYGDTNRSEEAIGHKLRRHLCRFQVPSDLLRFFAKTDDVLIWWGKHRDGVAAFYRKWKVYYPGGKTSVFSAVPEAPWVASAPSNDVTSSEERKAVSFVSVGCLEVSIEKAEPFSRLLSLSDTLALLISFSLTSSSKVQDICSRDRAFRRTN